MTNSYGLLQRLIDNIGKKVKSYQKLRVSVVGSVLIASIILCGYTTSEASQINMTKLNDLDNNISSINQQIIYNENEEVSFKSNDIVEEDRQKTVMVVSTGLNNLTDTLQNEKSTTMDKMVASATIVNTIRDINTNIEAKITAAELTEAKLNTSMAISADKIASTNAVKAAGIIKNTTLNATEKVKKTAKIEASKVSNQRKLSNEDYEVLLRIVEAEATGEDLKGKILVANVVLNRVDSKKFPNTVKAVVFQKNGSTVQFSPTKDGRYWSVKVSKDSKEAVKRALEGEDYSKGALFFSARQRASKNSMSWFDRSLKWLFQHGAHEFYTTK